MVWKITTIFIVYLTIKSAISGPHSPHPKGRKLFGGYRIAPKPCQPTDRAHVVPDAFKTVCMFSFDCSLKGEIVGQCRDGFLYGVCCQIPKVSNNEKYGYNVNHDLNSHEIDHVPDIPILLDTDGSPIDSSNTYETTQSDKLESKLSSTDPSTEYKNAVKLQEDNIYQLEDGFSSLLGSSQVLNNLQLPSLISHSEITSELQEKNDVTIGNPIQSSLANHIVQVVDPVDQLPALFSQQLYSHNGTNSETIMLNVDETNVDEYHEGSDVPSEAVKIAFPTIAPEKKTKYSTTERIKITDSLDLKNTVIKSKLNTSSISADSEKMPGASQVNIPAEKIRLPNKKVTVPSPSKQKVTNTASSILSLPESTTYMALTTRNGEDFMPTPRPASEEFNDYIKESDLNKEEIAINHIISLLNGTNEPKVTPAAGSTKYKWVSTNGLPKPSIIKLNTKQPYASSTEPFLQSYYYSPTSIKYHYPNKVTTQSSKLTNSYYSPSSYFTSSSTPTSHRDTSSSHSHSSKPTTNPPAPTVIVLGPLGSEYTTISSTNNPNRISGNTNKLSGVTTKISTNTIKPSLVTKNPNLTTLTHNISTVISGNKQVLSVSYISVNLKDSSTPRPSINNDVGLYEHNPNLNIVTKRPNLYTTLTSWSDKPSFHLKPSSSYWISDSNGDTIKVTRPGFQTTGSNCEDETPTLDDVNNFPPVRHPELDSTITHYQEKPTLVEPVDDFPTPVTLVEDAQLDKNVDKFVNEIVNSLKDNFQDLKNVVYNSKNITALTSSINTITKKPTPSLTTKKPTFKPPSKVTRKPIPTKISTTQKITTIKQRPTITVTRRPLTTKRTKPVKKLTTPLTSSDSIIYNTESLAITRPTEYTTALPEITPNADFRTICGIRPLMKSGRIVGGKGASFGEWPWQVLVREATWLGLFTKNKCGGVLITDKYVMTAAHCQPGFLASLVAVFGEFDISGELESRRSVSKNVRRVIVNRAYDAATFENDLALLELETPVNFDAHIVPICMPDDDTDYTNRMATVTGWGRLKYNGGVPSVLQEVKVPIMENSVCQEMFQTAGHSKLILESFMCAGYANGQKDSCEGDSGGPLTLQRPDGRWILVGTVSHGIKCAAPYLPGVYMRTTFFKPWLHSITGV